MSDERRSDTPGAPDEAETGNDPRRWVGLLAFVAAAVTLVSVFLPVVTAPSGEDLGFFDCADAPVQCGWLAAWLLVTVAGFVVLGLLTVTGARGREAGIAMIVAGAIGMAGAVGWAGFVTSVEDGEASIGSGPVLGILGCAIGLVTGSVLAGSQTRAASPKAPTPSSPPGSRRGAGILALPALVGAAGMGMAVFVPYVQFAEGQETSITKCGSAGCVWFTVEPLALAVAVAVVAVLAIANVFGARVAALLFAIGGSWGALLYLGYVGYPIGLTGSDQIPGASVRSGGWLGLASACLVLVAAATCWVAGRTRGSSADASRMSASTGADGA